MLAIFLRPIMQMLSSRMEATRPGYMLGKWRRRMERPMERHTNEKKNDNDTITGHHRRTGEVHGRTRAPAPRNGRPYYMDLLNYLNTLV